MAQKNPLQFARCSIVFASFKNFVRKSNPNKEKLFSLDKKLLITKLPIRFNKRGRKIK